MTRHVVVLAGGASYERDVSLNSGRRVAQALTAVDYEANVRDIDGNLVSTLLAERPDAVVIAVHGAGGEDGALRGVLELLRIPYVGAAAAASRCAWDKSSAKAALQRAGINTPHWTAISKQTFRDLGAARLLECVVAELGLPLVVKPAQGGSGLGVARVDSADALPAAVVAAFGFCDTVLIEECVDGIDIAVSIVEPIVGDAELVALPAVEISPLGRAYDYNARYSAGQTVWHVPARLSPATAEAIANTAIAAHRTLHLRDLSRVDLIVDPTGQAHVLEVNVSPGMTETSLWPMAAKGAGLDLGEVLSALIEQAIARHH